MKTKLPTPQQLPSGMWRCQVTVDGQRVSIVDDDPDRAQAKAVAVRAKLIEASKEPRNAVILRDAIENYIAARDNVLSPSTLRGYNEIMRNRFPALMKKKINQITETDLQNAINTDAKAVSYKTIKNAMGLVLAVLGEYKTINAKRLRYPQHIRKEHAYLDGDQIIKLISACEGDIAEIPILLGVWLGLRRSEIMGLQWECVDFERHKLRIDHTLVLNKDNERVVRQATKTTGSNRVLDCPQYILHKLEALQPDPKKRVGPVFHINPNTIYENLKAICERAGIPFVGVHGLRHTNASVMLSLGIVDKIAMSRGGWTSKETMERIYQHLFESDKVAADKAINAYFETMIAHENAHD